MRWSPVLVAVIVVTLTMPSAPASGPRPEPRAAIAPADAGPRQNGTANCTLVNFTSSVDAFPLSYFECLPAGFSNASGYPLAVFLHGLNESANTPQRGGYLTDFNTSWAPIASSWGFILLIVNTRTGDGFFINSPYTGPQEQDVWDAIHSEESRRSIASLYLFGSSMGTMGTFLIAGETPSAFAGIGAVLSFSDYFEEYDYLASGVRGGNLTATALAAIDGGALPNASATARAMWLALSGPRFDPQNFSSLREYIVHGANDLASPNNPGLWPYQQANDTVLNRSCLVAVDVGEPSNCTQPLTVLHALDPTGFDFRYVYEPAGVHTTDELNLTDMFAFWAGRVAPGIYWASMSGTPGPPPIDAVNFATIPSGCGSIAFGGSNYTWGQLDTVATGTYPVAATPCAGYHLRALAVDGNGTLDGATSQVTISGSAVVVASFAPIAPPPAPNVTFSVTPPSCGPVVVNGSTAGNGQVVALPSGSYSLVVGSCSGETFANWTVIGALSVANPTMSSTTLTVTGNGTVTAEFQAVIVPPPSQFSVAVLIDPDPCGADVAIGGLSYSNGSTARLVGGEYALAAPGCTGYEFVSWSLSGSLDLLSGARLDVYGNGTLIAFLQANATAPGHHSGASGANNSTGAPAASSLPYLPLGLAVAAAIVVVAVVLIWRATARRVRSAPPEPPTAPAE